MAGRMIVWWGEHPKVAPCSRDEFDRIYAAWGTLHQNVKAIGKVLRFDGYSHPEVIELLVLCQRHDKGEFRPVE